MRPRGALNNCKTHHQPNMTITYRKGPEKQADALSRLPHLSHLQPLAPVTRTLLHQLADLLPAHLTLLDSILDDIKAAYAADPYNAPDAKRPSFIKLSPTTSGTSTPASASPPTLPFAAASFTRSMTPLPLDTLATPALSMLWLPILMWCVFQLFRAPRGRIQPLSQMGKDLQAHDRKWLEGLPRKQGTRSLETMTETNSFRSGNRTRDLWKSTRVLLPSLAV